MKWSCRTGSGICAHQQLLVPKNCLRQHCRYLPQDIATQCLLCGHFKAIGVVQDESTGSDMIFNGLVSGSAQSIVRNHQDTASSPSGVAQLVEEPCNLFYGTQMFYIFLRLHHVIFCRLKAAREIAQAENLRVSPTHPMVDAVDDIEVIESQFITQHEIIFCCYNRRLHKLQMKCANCTGTTVSLGSFLQYWMELLIIQGRFFARLFVHHFHLINQFDQIRRKLPTNSGEQVIYRLDT